MARPPMRSAHGAWSLLQVATRAGVPRRVARICVERGWLSGESLSWQDVVLLRVGAALLDAPLPYTGQSRAAQADVAAQRDAAALAAVRRFLAGADRPREAALLVLPDNAMLVKSALLAAVAFDEAADVPVVMLPVGAWTARLRSELAEVEQRAGADAGGSELAVAAAS